MSIKTLTFEQAVELVQQEADYYPFATVSESGKAKIKEFADSFYDGKFYNLDAVLASCEQDAETMLGGFDHSVEFKRVNDGMFGGFVVDNLRLYPEDFDWSINE